MVKSDPASIVTDPRVSSEQSCPAKNLSAALTDILHHEAVALAQNRCMSQRHTVSPLQLHDIRKIVDPVLTSCGESVAVLTDLHGQTALEIGAYRPHWNVTGWVSDMKSFLQLQTKKTPDNVTFDKMPQASGASLRVIIAAAWAHRKFSESHYHIGSLVQGIRDLLSLLPDHGRIVLQDFALPDDSESFVTLDISNPQAAFELLEFAKYARSNVAQELQGFFIETLPSPRDNVQRFHLPAKWAVEFFHRWRLGIASDAPFDLTTLSLPQWTNLVEQCGARVVYRAPHFMGHKNAKAMANVMTFGDAQGQSCAMPAESFTMVIEKLPQQAPLAIYERRVSADKAKDIVISSLRDQESDERLDVVEIRHHEDDVLPWYFDGDMRLHVLIRSNVARPVINAVPRGTPNLDGRYWSGYLIEPLNIASIPGNIDPQVIADNFRQLLPQAKLAVGKATLGIEYYPAPEYLVQRVRGIFLPIKPVDAAQKNLPETVLPDGSHVIDVLADDVLRAISAGLIPDGKLEILIARLMVEQGVEPQQVADLSDQTEMKRAVKMAKDKREANVKRSIKTGEHMEAFIADTPTENIRAVRSLFVQEHLTASGRQFAEMQEHEFIMPSKLTTNTAVCIPMMADPVGKFLLSGEPRRLPIPHRMGTQEPMMHLPAFSLPSSVKTLDDARRFLASQLQCHADDLFVLGPSFFAQSQISAERVYPFLLSATPTNTRWMRWFKPMSRGLRQLITPPVEKTTAYMELKVARELGEWYQGFTPDMTHKPSVNQNASPFSASSGAAHLDRHPMIIPNME